MSYTAQTWADNDATKPVSAARMNYIEAGIAAVANGGSQPVLAPAPSGDTTGATDTAALQAAITSALSTGSKLVTSDNGLTPYYINAPLVITPPASSPDGYAYMDWEHHGYAQQSIVWAGGNGGTMLSAVGWKRSRITGLKLAATTASSIIFWDVDVTAAHPSTSFLSWYDCTTILGTGTSNVGWRMGHTSGGAADISFISWFNCDAVADSSVPAGTIGWVNESSNGLNWSWFGGGAYYCAKAFTNVSTAGAGSAVGNDAMFFYGFGGSHNGTDFEFSAPGSYIISGSRVESGTTFLNVPSASSHVAVTCTSVVIAAYPATGVFNFLRPGSLILDGCYAYGTAYTAGFITLNGFTSNGALCVRAGAYRCTDPMWTVAGGTWNVEIDSVGLLNATSQSTGYMTQRNRSAEPTLRRGLGIITEPYPVGSASGTTALGTQQLLFDAVALIAGQVVTNVGWFQSVAGSGLTLLKTALADKTGKILAVSADSSASPGSANSYVALAMGSAYTVLTDDVYYLCLLPVGTTPPTVARGLNATGSGDHVPGSTIIRSGVLTAQTDFPAVGSSFSVATKGSFWPYIFAT